MNARRPRRVYGASLHGEIVYRKPKPDRTPAICGRCYRVIDRAAVLLAISEGREYVHACGRKLA